MRSRVAGVAIVAVLGAAGIAACAPSQTPALQEVASTTLAGRTIVIDPGHQLGNHNYPIQINAPVDAGGFQKPCNTTGTSSSGGYPEATFAWQVSLLLKARLVARGATVVVTRTSNREDRWGPCVDSRGRRGNRFADGTRADLKISIHGDGCKGCGAGFHVIAPKWRAGWTDDIATSSLAFAKQVRTALHDAGLPYAPYVSGGDGLDVRGDLGTLNWSDRPSVMVELGNMRNAADAARMISSAGRERYADALTRAIVARLT